MVTEIASGRTFHDYPGSHYFLPADEEERRRLKSLHEVVKEVYGGILFHPPFDRSSSYFILESGTGAGTWILDFAAQLPPTAILHGIDISTRLFPPSHPRNVSFSQSSILNLPAEWSGRFDFAHQRLLASGLTLTDWRTALNGMSRVLVPGGWVQLCEPAIWTAGPATQRCWNLLCALHRSKNGSIEIGEMLPDMLANAGFINVTTLKRSITCHGSSEQAVEARASSISVVRAMKTATMKAGGLGIVSSGEEFDGLVVALEKEWLAMEGSRKGYTIIYAQKPEREVAAGPGM